jgi:hypothetical protein
MVQIQYIYNINEPSEWTTDNTESKLSGDEFVLVVKYENVDLYYTVPYDAIEDQYIKSKRNSLIRFFNLVVPCNGLRIHLKEKDKIEAWSDTSNTVKFDCDTIGVTENLFWIGNDPSRGKYRMISTV